MYTLGGRLALLITIILVLSPLYAAGGREDPLAYADVLIEEQQYDEALLYLSEFIKEYPNRFDQAQAKIRRIIAIRSAYNRQADSLIDVLIDEPTNNEKKIALIRDLENFERNPSPALRDFVVQTRDLALFTFNRARFEEIMAEGRFLIDQRRFAEAAVVYTGGFELYRPEFAFSGFEGQLVHGSLSTVDGVTTAARDFQALASRLTTAMNQLATAFNTAGTAGLEPAFVQAEAASRLYTELRNRVARDGRELEATFASLQAENPELTDNSFLPFAFRLVLGRRTEDQLEGVTGAMDAQWAYSLGLAQTAMEDQLDRHYAQALAAIDAGDWLAGAEALESSGRLAEAGQRLVALWSQLAPDDLLVHAAPLGLAILESKGQDLVRLDHHARLMRDWAGLARLEAGVDSRYQDFVRLGAETDLPEADYRLLRDAIAGQRQEMLALQSVSGERADWLAVLTASGYGQEVSADRQGAFDGSLFSALGRAEASVVQIAAREAGVRYGALDERLDGQQELLLQAEAYLAGLPSDDPLLPEAIFRYPSLSLESLAQASGGLQQLDRDLEAFLNGYRGEQPYIAGSAAMSLWIQRGQQLLDQTRATQARLSAIESRAREQKQLADSSRFEAEQRVRESRAALAAANFEQARERLERARERYNDSLGFEQNVALRRDTDNLMQELAVAIVRAENDLVVADTRRLLTAGRTAYLAGQFDQAEQNLLQARARWSTTNVTPEGEVEYWLRLVQNALAVKSGRDIPVTAPLYPEMSQLLSNAKQWYEEGARQLAARNTTGALRSFALARENLDKIRLVFPLNQEASILALRIDRLIDIDAFNRKAASMVAEARTKIQNRSDVATAYSDLKDIEALEPRYPGIQPLIEQAEILLGLRLPPPNPAALAESRSLTSAAQRIWDSRDTGSFPVAITQLNRAIELNPTNNDASSLKDRIQTYVGGQATLVLPSAAEALYNEAVRLFTSGEYLATRGRLVRLYDGFPQARRVQKVMDLDTRLAAIGY